MGGAPEVTGLTLASSGPHVALLGPARGVFEVIAGVRGPDRGTVRVAGVDPREGLRDGAIASATLDPPLPPKWTAVEHASWAARLAGVDAKVARAAALASLDALGVPGGRVLKDASPVERRAIVCAGALATEAKTLVVEDPTAGLPADAARALGRAFARALGDRGLVLLAGTLPLDAPLALAIDDALVVRAGRVVAQGAPAEIAAREKSYAVRALGDVARFVRLVEDGGGSVSGATDGAMAIDLGADLKPRDLFALAEDARAVLVEVLPLGRAFS